MVANETLFELVNSPGLRICHAYRWALVLEAQRQAVAVTT
jgi:hypothetical protein